MLNSAKICTVSKTILVVMFTYGILSSDWLVGMPTDNLVPALDMGMRLPREHGNEAIVRQWHEIRWRTNNGRADRTTRFSR